MVPCVWILQMEKLHLLLTEIQRWYNQYQQHFYQDKIKPEEISRESSNLSINVSFKLHPYPATLQYRALQLDSHV